jgi:hypothetical protein
VPAPVVSPSPGHAERRLSSSTPAKSTITAAATNAGMPFEVKMPRYMRMVCTAYTSGTMTALVEA